MIQMLDREELLHHLMSCALLLERPVIAIRCAVLLTYIVTLYHYYYNSDATRDVVIISLMK